MTVYRHTFEFVKSYVEEHGNGTILLSTEYENTDVKMDFKCRCGNKFSAAFKRFKGSNKRQCNKCGRKGINKKYDTSTLKNKFRLHGLEPLFEHGEGARKKHLALNSNGYKVVVSAEKLKQGKTPDSFSKFNPYTIENIQKFINDNELGMILISSEYKNNREKLEMICPNGHHFQVPWSDFQWRKRCTSCYYSKGEERIRRWLSSEGIEYKTEFTFDDLRGRRNQPLRYDFAIFDRGNLTMLIEYDGELHFEPARYSKNDEKNMKKLKLTQFYDSLKEEYAEDNNIDLLRIPYTEYENIEEILAAHL